MGLTNELYVMDSTVAGYSALTGVSVANTAPSFIVGDGKLVTDFDSKDDSGISVALQPDGKILVAGFSQNLDGNNQYLALVRYQPDGTLDTSFSEDGMLTTDFGSGGNLGLSIIVQPDGKILVAGRMFNGNHYDFGLVRYQPDGSLDTSFSGDGKLNTDFGYRNDTGTSAILQPDGKILVAGRADKTTDCGQQSVRHQSDKDLNTIVSEDSKLTTGFRSRNGEDGIVTVQPDGKILSAGSTDTNTICDIAMVRFNTDGSLDTSFSDDGKLTTDFYPINSGGESVILQPDGKILVAGSTLNLEARNMDFALVRYNTDGSLDTSFSEDGKQTTDFGPDTDYGFSAVLQSDGRILVAGFSDVSGDNDFALVRYLADGSLDTSFSGDGKLTTDLGYNSGEYDNDVVRSVIVQPDGKILVAGESRDGSYRDFALARYHSDGSLDTSFSEDGIQITDFASLDDVGFGVTLQPDGKILVAGASNNGNGSNFDFALARYHPDGTLDNRFDLQPVSSYTTSIHYTENASPIILDHLVLVKDAELAAQGHYGGASITLSRHGGANVQDIFSSAGNFSGLTEGSNLVYSGTTILGTVTQNSGGTLAMTFNGNATEVLVNEMLASIAYSNNSDAPEAQVQIDWTFNDGNTGGQGTGGALSAIGSTTVTITAVNDAAVGSVTINGVTTQGETLTASNDLADADGLGAITYQWQADGADIGGANSSTYVLTQNEVGKVITVKASYIDAMGTEESVISAATSAVLPVPSLVTGKDQLAFGMSSSCDFNYGVITQPGSKILVTSHSLNGSNWDCGMVHCHIYGDLDI